MSGRRAGRKIFEPWVRYGHCRVTHALLPAFVLAWRLDVAETVGRVIGQVADGVCDVRPAAVHRFRDHAPPALGAGFAALAVELRGQAVTPAGQPGCFALAAITATFGAAVA
jgi:hypothetical protein